MKEPLNRTEIIRLLKNLGSSQDVDVLSAARDLNQQITSSGLDWDELLIPEEEQSSHVSENHEEKDIIDSNVKGDVNSSLTLIEKILSNPERSDALREELEEYKNDISNGDFTDDDHKYVRALFDRLSK
jgi:hypothetical protein